MRHVGRPRLERSGAITRRRRPTRQPGLRARAACRRKTGPRPIEAARAQCRRQAAATEAETTERVSSRRGGRTDRMVAPDHGVDPTRRRAAPGLGQQCLKGCAPAARRRGRGLRAHRRVPRPPGARSPDPWLRPHGSTAGPCTPSRRPFRRPGDQLRPASSGARLGARPRRRHANSTPASGPCAAGCGPCATSSTWDADRGGRLGGSR